LGKTQTNQNKIYIIVLPAVLYGYETLSLTIREEHRLRVFENRVLRKILGPESDQIIEEWRKLRKEVYDLYSSSSSSSSSLSSSTSSSSVSYPLLPFRASFCISQIQTLSCPSPAYSPPASSFLVSFACALPIL
jgi:hypothetical protein